MGGLVQALVLLATFFGSGNRWVEYLTRYQPTVRLRELIYPKLVSTTRIFAETILLIRKSSYN